MTDEELFSNPDGIVEANQFEHSIVYEKYKKEWKSETTGKMVTVGFFGKLPVCISLRIGFVRGKKIFFWYTCSRVIDHQLIDEWFDKVYPSVRRVDAENMSRVLG